MLAAHAAIALENARLYEQSRELSVEAERNRLALDLHDSLAQKLFALRLSAESAETLLDRDPAAAREQVTKLQDLAEQAVEELRSIVFELRPPELEKDGLVGALRKHVGVLRRLGQGEIELDLAEELPPDPERDRDVLRIAQEALQNATRHSDAKRIVLHLHSDHSRLLLEVEDNGIGFSPEAPELRSRRLGLTSMEERAKRLGGSLQIFSERGAGTTVRLELGGD